MKIATLTLCSKSTVLIRFSFKRHHYLPDYQLHFQHGFNWVRSWFQQKWLKKKVLPALIHWVYSWRRRSRGAPLSKILHASSFICGCSSCPVSSTVTPEHSAAAKHLAPSPTVQMKNKHNLPFWVSSKWGISWQIEGWFIMQRQKTERRGDKTRERCGNGSKLCCYAVYAFELYVVWKAYKNLLSGFHHKVHFLRHDFKYSWHQCLHCGL